MDAAKYAAGSRAAQGAVSFFRPELIVDGKWGSFSDAAYEKLTESERRTVDSVTSSLGVTVKELSQFRKDQKEAARANVGKSNGSVDEAIKVAASESGVPESVLKAFAAIESNFNPNAANGSSRGLMQMQPAAWATALAINPRLPGYDKVFDPEANARAGAALIKANRISLGKYGIGDPSPAMLYLAHQQGAAGFNELYRSWKGLPVSTSYVTERAMKGNPPQDGKGVTLDKKEFFDRWLKAAEKKMAAY